MADITRRIPDCDDDCGERGPRGPRGPAGPEGPAGLGTPDGITIVGDGTTELPLAGGALTPQFVFKPGGVAGNSTYPVFADLYADMQAVIAAGARTVFLTIDDRLGAAIIPVGTWDLGSPVIITDVSKAGVAVDMILADGASILATAAGNIVTFWTSNMRVISNRVGSVAPFLGVNAIAIGNRTRFLNTLSGVLPMFVHNASTTVTNFIALSGSNAFGGIGDDVGNPTGALPSPLIDVRGGPFLLGGGTGFVQDNAFTDTVGGGIIVMRMMDDAFNGGSYPGQNYLFPAFETGGGTYSWRVETRDRRLVLGPTTGATFGPIVTTPPLTNNAIYNALVLVDTSTTAVTVTAPRAYPGKGERLTLKDISNNAAANNITLAPSGTNVINQPVINTNGGAAEWVCDGRTPVATWWRVSST